MHLIEHIIEPQKLLLAWQSSDERQCTRYIVAELERTLENKVDLTYLKNSQDFCKAKEMGFESYPAFNDINEIYHDVIDAFMRRLPPRTRGDFSQYMEGFRLRPDARLSDFALLGYSGAKLPSDGFSIINPFYNVNTEFELLLEAAGYRHLRKNHDGIKEIKINDRVVFFKNFNQTIQEDAFEIKVDSKVIGYVNRGLLPVFSRWMEQGRVSDAWIEKINGSPEKPSVYLYVKISSIS